MARVTVATPRTKPSSQAITQPTVNFTADMFGAQIGGALGNMGQAVALLQEKEKQVQRFDAIGALETMETDVKIELEKLKQDTPENAANFFEQAEAIVANRQAEILNGLPPHLQPEFEARAQNVRQRMIADAFRFDFTQKNLYFSNRIKEMIEQEKLGTDQNPITLQEREQKIHRYIDASGLAEIDKTQQKRLASAQLQAIAYRQSAAQVHQKALTDPNRRVAAIDLPPVAAGVLAAIARRESGGRYNVRYGGPDGPQTFDSFADHPRQRAVISEGEHQGQTSTAAGKYQFIAGTWDQVRKETGITDFRPESQDRGAWHWAQKTVKQQTGKTVDELVQAGDFATLKNALGTQWEGVKKMSLQEFTQEVRSNAGKFTDYSALDADPRFAALPFDQREALRRDGERQATSLYNQQLQMAQAREAELKNGLFVSLLDGKAGLAEINEARKEGWLSRYEDINKAQGILTAREGNMRHAAEGFTKLENGGVWSMEDADDRNRANAIFGDSGRAAIEKRDQGYVQGTILPRFSKMGMAAPDMVNMLLGMARHSDPANSVYAYETLRQMREANPAGFTAQFGKDVQRNLDFYEARRNFSSPEQIVGQLNNVGQDSATRAGMQQLRKEAREMLDDAKFELDKTATRGFNGYFDGYGGELPSAPALQAKLRGDYRAAFEENFILYGGNVDAAKAATQKDMERLWAVTSIGGRTSLKRLPPERAGYPPIAGGYDWIEARVRVDLNLRDAKWFELVADETTELEVGRRQASFGRGLSAERSDVIDGAGNFATAVEQSVNPSYLVYYEDKNGVRRMATLPNGKLARIDFAMSPAEKATMETEFATRQRTVEDEDIIRRYREESFKLRNDRLPIGATPQQIDPQLQTDFDEVMARRAREQERTTQERGQNLGTMGGFILPQ